MNDRVDSVAALETCVGKTPGPMHLKVIDHLDEGARRWIATSPLAFVAFGDGRSLRVDIAGAAPGFVQVVSERSLRLPLAALDGAADIRENIGFGALFLVPHLGETLRVNGRCIEVRGDALEVRVEECYVHCAKALIRSEFWSAAAGGVTPVDAQACVASSRFVAMATSDAQGHVDVSPKGDPAGAMLRCEDGSVWMADRPGNRRTDGFRNILGQPRIAALALRPGSTTVAVVEGVARLSREGSRRAAFAVQDRTPQLVLEIAEPRMTLRPSPALARVAPWSIRPLDHGLDPAAILASHVQANRSRGLQARLVGALVSPPGMMRRGLDADYKRNLY